MLWNCQASRIEFLVPPGASGWAIGCWSEFYGNAAWESANEFVNPRSLYQAQLADRLGAAAAQRVGNGPKYPPGGTNPTSGQAAEAVAASSVPAQTIADLVQPVRRRRENPHRSGPGAHVRTDDQAAPRACRPRPNRSPPASIWR